MRTENEPLFRKVPFWFRGGEWLIRLLRLTKAQGTACEPGLVFIQIDELSRHQFERARAQRHLFFLVWLRKKQGYELHSLYSGLPSSTPAMTAELLYGVKCAVPSFCFYSRPAGAIFRMFEARSARQIDRRLLAQGPPLLAGGSAYACIYTGGAAETHFCACTITLDDLFRRHYPLRLLIILLFSVYSLLRVAVLLGIESLLAVFDCARGLIAGQDLWKELKFVPSRVGVSILMRELATIGVTIDVTRGLPTIYLDFVGYDEQAHRRGPNSRFAHWSLKGIDGAIARIWKAARRSSQRNYAVWVFSDHGSEEMVSCLRQTGRTLQESVTEIFGRLVRMSVGEHDAVGRRPEMPRASLAGRSSIRPRVTLPRERTSFVGPTSVESRTGRHAPVVAAMGPIGHVYLDQALDRRERDRIAAALVERARIPMVTVIEGRDRVRVWRQDGQFLLPEEAALVFAPDHPFLAEIVRDFRLVCRHPDAGDFMLWGWTRSGSSCVLSIESGSHAGPGLEETHAFALLPHDAPVQAGDKSYLRPLDLRQAALRHLGRDVRQVTLASASGSVKTPLPELTHSVR